ncbi:DUF7350 domain-containing protein [Natrinema versiforme]|uniref:DUF7350 domain-containing protein n=1 Tax=Natrinema versiforme JCM 10478 TaxID=1227496 RepID=L9Y5E6_9EURY|nr:hypothetical protein [Natrinema versiforme]ELY69290.1 hypothetical protein C489_05033 [Natrinema versiforme JCM 10478]
MNRRTFLRRTAPIPAALAVAGCAAPGSESDGRNASGDRENGGSSDDDVTGTAPIPMLEDPPEAVYLPGHRKSMRALEPITAGDYAIAPMLSYPHPFWVVTGTDRRLVEPESGRGVHLMLVCWDRETDTVLPGGAEPTVTIEGDGERLASRSLWPMLSQEMGLHFGDNVSLPADGTYAVSVELPPLPTRRTGSLAGRFADGGTATFEFTYDEAFREEVVDGIELLDRERWGEQGALEPMTRGSDGGMDGMAEIPYSALPPAEEYPGTRLVDPTADPDGASAGDLPRSGDAAFVVTLLESGSRLADGDGRYLLVSPRTPYNRVPLTNTSLRAVVERDGEPVGDSPVELGQTLDGEVGLHYGRSLADIRAGDAVTIEIESPPQTARHQGYETAFFEIEPLELAVPD